MESHKSKFFLFFFAAQVNSHEVTKTKKIKVCSCKTDVYIIPLADQFLTCTRENRSHVLVICSFHLAASYQQQMSNIVAYQTKPVTGMENRKDIL